MRAVKNVNMDYEYLCGSLGSFSGLHVRVYSGGVLRHSFQEAEFSPDPMLLLEDAMLGCPRNASCHDIGGMIFFGAVKEKGENAVIAIGPVTQKNLSEQQLFSLTRQLRVPLNKKDEFSEYIASARNYKLKDFLNLICFIDYSLNSEKITARDLIWQEISIEEEAAPKAKKKFSSGCVNSYETELDMLSHITYGQPDALRDLFEAPAPDEKAASDIKKCMIGFISSATLASRAAIAGGLPQEAAFSMSGLYIQKAEQLESCNEILRLNMKMLIDFASCVEGLSVNGVKSKLVSDVTWYIYENMSRKLSTAEIARHLSVSNYNLYSQFKKETGTSVNDFIIEMKIREAKRLLSSSRETIAEISQYLHFSSQGYFQNVFKRLTGLTPGEFRKNAGSPKGLDAGE
ncbi:MAG: helix-turn-helix transcriptional regulator [Clostridiales bacterium]|nr:helix-turn-helix transcriptional regulator [Clostridiales bacterium]